MDDEEAKVFRRGSMSCTNDQQDYADYKQGFVLYQFDEQDPEPDN